MFVRQAERSLSRLVSTGALVLLASALAVLLLRGLEVERVSGIYFIAVVVSAAAFGVWWGLFAALASTVAFNFVTAGPAFGLALGAKQDLANLVIFVCGAWVAGLYIDEARRERDALARLTKVDVSPLPNRALRRLIELAFFTWAPLQEILRVLAAICLAASSVGIGSLVAGMAGPLPISMVYLAGVVVSASMLGARYALVTAILNVIAYDYFVLEPRHSLTLDSLVAGINLVVFLAVGWQVGRFAERVRYEQRVVRSLFEAGGSFSAIADEPTLRQRIAEAVSALTNGGYVIMRDEGGLLAGETGERPLSGAPRVNDGDDRWAHRALQFHEREFGVVSWLKRGADPDRPAESAIGGVLDLGAAAIARARMSSDNARLAAVEEAEELRRALLASVSHDFRTPLAGILGSATSLVDLYDQYDDAVRRDLLSNIREQAFRLSRYVENLLGMSRVESRSLQPKIRALALEAIVYETWESIADGAPNARPDVNVAETLAVRADPDLLRQALSNLLENAIKYSPPGRPVEVSAREQGAQVVLSVADFGPGAPLEDVEQLFQPFYRARNTKAGGVGLGLFIARSFLEAMGGSITAKRRSGAQSGMIFELTLPNAGVFS